MIEQTVSLRANGELSALAKGSDHLLDAEINRYSRMASGTWDLQADEKGRPLLVLALRDPFGYASDSFAPDEFHHPEKVAVRFHRLIGNLLQSSRRVNVAIQETKLSAQQLEALRSAINGDANLLKGNPRLQNQILRINADGSFTVRDFSIEVDESALEAAKQAVRNAGLTLKIAPLSDKPGVLSAVQSLVTAHRQDPTSPPRLVLWFRVDDPKDVHLLEIADDVADPGDGALDGVALGAGRSVPGARSIVIYLASPSEVHKAFEVNSGHPAIEAMVNRTGHVLHPAGDWQALINEFPEIAHQPVS